MSHKRLLQLSTVSDVHVAEVLEKLRHKSACAFSTENTANIAIAQKYAAIYSLCQTTERRLQDQYLDKIDDLEDIAATLKADNNNIKIKLRGETKRLKKILILSR